MEFLWQKQLQTIDHLLPVVHRLDLLRFSIVAVASPDTAGILAILSRAGILDTLHLRHRADSSDFDRNRITSRVRPALGVLWGYPD